MRVSAKLADSLRFDSSVRDEAALQAFEIRPRGVREAIAHVVSGTA